MANWENVSETTLTDSKRIRIMFDSVLFCARQGIVMKGQIKKPLYQYSDDECDNDDQVTALSSFLLQAANNYNPTSELKRLSNATALTKQTQDRILETCREMLTSKIVAEVKEAQFFTLIAEKTLKDDDGVRIPLFVRFVDKNLKIREELLQYVSRGTRGPDESWGETIGKNIVRVITELGLSMEFCRGLNFDSGNNVLEVSEVVRKIQADYPKAIYVHARSDLLNVCIASTCEIQFVFHTLYEIEFTAKLFTEEKEIKELLESMIKEVMPESEDSRLIELSQTNWGETVQRFSNLVELFPAVIATYDEVREGSWRKYIRDDDKRCTASGVSLGMLKFEFIICMVIVTNFLELTLDLTDELQKACYNSSTICEKVSELQTKLDELKSNIEERHSAWYEKAVDLATKIDIKPEKEKIYGLKPKTTHDPDESISEHYLKLITLPFLDHMKAQIELRFSQASLDALDGLAMMPCNVVSNPKSWKTAASRFMERYKHDQPDDIYYDAELGLWETSWEIYKGTPPNTALELLSTMATKFKYMTQVRTAFKIFTTLPVIPTESETPRVMPFIHEELCLYSMTDNYLNALALLSIRGKELETEDVIECYKKKYTLPMMADA